MHFYQEKIAQLLLSAQKHEKNNSEKEKIPNETYIYEKDDLKSIEKSLRSLLMQKEQVILYQEKTIMGLRFKIEVKLV